MQVCEIKSNLRGEFLNRYNVQKKGETANSVLFCHHLVLSDKLGNLAVIQARISISFTL